ncbi:hypothetical protein PGTUg99_004694 [Puccinia graminis f. sp. tritici]|uniref:Uncharacterized protein n=1 Tax=Puccinia graminis f. sp. tritici TaxID=56615 RepID=A0A5B0NR32_PUCGR|nr:hypothetical protein PGTUg99_004694 [Puccinia graminis f. sp. tritici]
MRWISITLFTTLCLTAPALLSLPIEITREGESSSFLLPDLNGPPIDETLDLNSPPVDDSLAEPRTISPCREVAFSSLSATTSILRGNRVNQQAILVSHVLLDNSKRINHPAIETSPGSQPKKGSVTQASSGTGERNHDDIVSKRRKTETSTNLSVKTSLVNNPGGFAYNDRKRKRPTESIANLEEVTNNQLAQETPETPAAQDLIGDGQKSHREILFDLKDWNYVRLPPELTDTNEDHESSPTRFALGKFFETLQKCQIDLKGEDGKDKNKAQSMSRRYLKIKLGIASPSEFDKNYDQDPGIRQAVLFDIVLSLSDTKLKLEDNRIFSQGIVDYFTETLEPKRKKLSILRSNSELSFRTAESKRPSRVKGIAQRLTRSIIDYVKNTTKIATFLVIIQLSLFGEHEQDVLTTAVVDEILNFFRKMWIDTENFQEELIGKYGWAKKNAAILSLQNPEELNISSRYKARQMYQMAWNFAGYWAEANGKTVGGSFKKRQNHRNIVIKLGNKIIHYANYEIVARKMHAIKQNQKKAK